MPGWLSGTLILIVPILLFLIGGFLMMRATGRATFRQRRSQPQSEPLNFRLRGYNATSARDYWIWLGPEGRAAEVRFLKADMIFPFWYGGLMLVSMLTAWRLIGRPFSVVVLAAPVVITVLADWLENVMHLQLLSRFSEQPPIQEGPIKLASLSTSTKLVFFWLSAMLMLGLAVSVMIEI